METVTAVLVIALTLSAAGNAVLGITVWHGQRTIRDVLRCIPEYRERATEGTARVYSPWRKDQRARKEGDETS